MRRSTASARALSSLLDAYGPLYASNSAMQSPTWRRCQQRTLKLFEIFDREKAEERKARLKEDMQRGYFDDFKQLRDTQGRVFEPDAKLTLAREATSIPSLQVVQPSGEEATFPSGVGGFTGGLLCVGFREGSEAMLQPWSQAFTAEFAGRDTIRWFQLALVESVVMRVWPFSNLIVRSPLRRSSQSQAMPAQHLFHFGEATEFKRALGITNQLTGYVYLIDGTGHVRWRASGPPSAADTALMLQSARQLFNEPTFQGHS